MAQKPTRKKFWIPGLTALVLAAVGVAVFLLSAPQKTEFRTHQVEPALGSGQITEGNNAGGDQSLKTESKLVYESNTLDTNEPQTNALGVQWSQASGAGEGQGTNIEIRTHDGKDWSPWTALGGTDDRKDGTDLHGGVVLTANAKQFQYRFTLNGQPGSPVAVSTPKFTVIDSTRGPDPTKSSGVATLFGQKAKAKADAPRIYSRTEWGCPEGESSPRWQPEDQRPDEIIVHHTAATVSPSNSAAAIRAVWYQHANTNGWGDIGYNYLVDLNGNIFQGRYYDKAHAEQYGVDVVGGHTLNGHNYHSIGVATLGNFTNQGVTGPMLNGIGVIAGYKAAPFLFNPAGRLYGHRDMDSTNCPGNNLYANLPNVRAIAGNYYSHFLRWNQYDYEFSAVFVNGAPGGAVNLRASQSATLSIDLKNIGTDTWVNSGQYPTRLGTSHPLDRLSGFRNGSWLNDYRAATFTQKVTVAGDGSRTTSAANSIAPNEIARFTFTVTAPNVSGSFVEYFQPVVDGYSWFVRDRGLNWTINVTPNTYSYQLLDFSGAAGTQPNVTATHTLTIKNTGNIEWTNTGDSRTIRIGTEQPKDHASMLYDSGSWLSPARVGTFAGKAQLDGNGNVVKSGGNVVYDDQIDTIQPGEAAHFIFTSKAPQRPFVGNEHFNFVVDGVAWLNDVGIFWPVDIRQNYHAQLVGWSPGPTIPGGGTATVYLDYKNTGTYSWKKNDHVAVGTANPLDRMSNFQHSSWRAGNRVNTFAGEVTGGVLDTASGDAQTIDPGETGRFQITLDAAGIPAGTYNEYFRLVADGFAWLEWAGEFFPVTVQ